MESSSAWLFVCGNGVYIRHNSQTNFKKITIGIPADINVTSICNDLNGAIYLGSQDGSIYEDYLNAKFSKITSGLPNAPIYKIAYNHNTNNLYVCTKCLYTVTNGVKWDFANNSQHTDYNDGTNNWVISNNTIYLAIKFENTPTMQINGNYVRISIYVLDGINFNAIDGKYEININDEGTITEYHFQVKKKIVNDLGFNPNVGIMDEYIGYLNGIKNNRVEVIHIYSNDLNQAILGMSLVNEYIIDWNKTFYQPIDTKDYSPIGDKVILNDNITEIALMVYIYFKYLIKWVIVKLTIFKLVIKIA